MSAVKTIPLSLKDNPYRIFIGDAALGCLPAFVRQNNLGNHAVIITTSKLKALYTKLIRKTFSGIEYTIVTVVDGERAKSKEWLFKVLKHLIKSDRLGRRLFVVCLGGGVVGDLGGFAAAVYKRGIPYLQIPTTLLAQIDSSIGGKTAIDLEEAKNILGAFYQPKAVFTDPRFLRTLPVREIKQGMAEAIKYGVISDKVFFDFLEKQPARIKDLDSKVMLRIITTCAGIKAKIVACDEKETKGLRTILNFGHTFAHALESSFNYRKITHGDAVSLGMCYAARLSQALGKCEQAQVSKLISLLRLYSLPPPNFSSRLF